MNNSPVILYVEDEETDATLFAMAFKRAGVPNAARALHTVVDGVQAIDYLAGNGPFADRNRYPLPALVLLDLNLPRKSGFDVLEWARQQPKFTSLPIIVYTSSARESDRDRALQLGANDYLIKRANINEIATLARGLAERWLAPNTSP